MARLRRLVIGYGNTLRSDDGAGYRVAEQVAEWGIEGVRSHPCHQLMPELAAEIAEADTVFFVDAMLPQPESLAIQVVSLAPEAGSPALGHTLTPRALLWFSQTLYDHCPQAHLITIPSESFEFGEQFSAVAQQGIAAALGVIYDRLTAADGTIRYCQASSPPSQTRKP
jgi:hydrogenase maturation protease